MDTLIKKQPDILDFPSFIKEFFDWYVIDDENRRTIQNLSLWANRNPKFNGIEPGWHIDRGLLVMGNPGAGKDELLRLLNQYLKFLGSQYIYSHRIVWEFAADFQNKERGGYGCFSGEGKGNRHYEELALTDPATNYPTREVVNHFGTKVLIGAELIHITHNAFKNYGFQSHFSTNEPENRLFDFYGERAISRLKYMCNFIKFFGEDRRENAIPVFMKNANQPVIRVKNEVEVSRQMDEENTFMLEEGYRNFLESGVMPQYASLTYMLMVAKGVKVCTEEDLQEIKESLAETYVPEISISRKNETEREEEKKLQVQIQSKVTALKIYYNLLKSNGATSIFGEKVANVDLLAEKIIK